MMFQKKKTKKISYDVQCVYDRNHVFKEEFQIVVGSEAYTESEVEIYCPQCEKLVTVVIKGQIMPDKPVYRGMGD